jgi:hypothetical protein
MDGQACCPDRPEACVAKDDPRKERSRNRFLCALAALPLFAGAAVAQPAPLTSRQMDRVTAGFLEIDASNTSLTVVSIFQRPYLTDPTPNTIVCPGCYLLIVTPTFSVASQFGP